MDTTWKITWFNFDGSREVEILHGAEDVILEHCFRMCWDGVYADFSMKPAD